MNARSIIEVGGEAVGIVVPDAGQFRFVAVKYAVWTLDDHIFDSAESARLAASREMAPRGQKSRQSSKTISENIGF